MVSLPLGTRPFIFFTKFFSFSFRHFDPFLILLDGWSLVNIVALLFSKNNNYDLQLRAAHGDSYEDR